MRRVVLRSLWLCFLGVPACWTGLSVHELLFEACLKLTLRVWEVLALSR